MTHRSETEVQRSVRRLMSALGKLFHEMTALMEAGGRPADRPRSEAAHSVEEHEPKRPAPEPVGAAPKAAPAATDAAVHAPVMAGPSQEAAPWPAEERDAFSTRIRRAVGNGLTAMLGPDAGGPTAQGPSRGEKDAPASGYAGEAEEMPMGEKDERPAEPLKLVCEGEHSGILAFPWDWVVRIHEAGDGRAEALTVSLPQGDRRMPVRRVLGIWTVAEIQTWDEEVHLVSNPEELLPISEATRSEVASAAPAIGSADRPPEIPPVPAPIAPAATPSVTAVSSSGGAPGRRVWVVSPSALTRRFLMRHLDQAGLDAHEARDLDDPALPADLESAGALFLDESLVDIWRRRPTSGREDLPLVVLTVDGAVQIPSVGAPAEQTAVLPRPFERSEVESVVAWLHSNWEGSRAGGGQHGNPEDDTWLFADPFGKAGPGERPGRG